MSGETPAKPPVKPARKPMSDARIGGMVATGALVFLAVFTGLFIWIGG